ncbi:trehalose-phosphatase [Actinorhabdospora filicis]|uniref:Trehalose-phosphatase n=2 Tax=Actinorhabdospora filicis TaxID=1785913 RepID=A0A9W6W8N9_9ACTN|nr:trehalose-phosphatase [Actinorhabdospora filicis]
MDPELRACLANLARTPQLLIACDYDGTLAPIVTDPAKAAPLPETVAALRALATLPQTKVAVISGRALRDLAALSRLPSEIHLVGSHGSEFDVSFTHALTPEQVTLRDKIYAAVADLVRDKEGVRLEPKPAGIAVHTRTAPRDVAAEVLAAIQAGPGSWDDVQSTEGKEVVDLSVMTTHKGTALDALRSQLGASAVLFIGDDVTDENAFAHLHGPDMGIRVGEGETLARHRVDDTEDVAHVLADLLQIRRGWLYGEQSVLIERHSMLADGAANALVTPDARITWMCHPKPDSGALFADLLGGTTAGHFTVEPVGGGLPLGQRYRHETMSVETRWSGLTVTDWLDRTHLEAGDAHSTTLVRELSGNGTARVTFAPRPEFGSLPVRLQPLGDGLLMLGYNEPLVLRAPGVEWEVTSDGQNDTATATVDLTAFGGHVALEMRCGSNDLSDSALPVGERREGSEAHWRDWAAKLNLPRLKRDMVMRSALALRALCYEPTGAILAAATTSLPEDLGGVRNWDYRYCWFRDGAMSARALVELGSLPEAERFLKWCAGVLESTGGHPEWLSPLYTIDGGSLPPEGIIDTLPGYAGSRPVRVNNNANKQVQLDVFGPVADLVAAVADLRGRLTDFEAEVILAMADAVERRWHEPDHGIWEAPQPPRHHVYSKVMCWFTIDKAIQLADRHGLPRKESWAGLRAAIAENVLEHGWDENLRTYTAAYGEPDLDAATLWIGLTGLLDPADQRFIDTVEATEAALRSGSAVYRYKRDDGLPGVEGGFLICAAWLIESYLKIGRRADAEELFTQLIDQAGPTGLFPEQWDPLAERGLGNHPQAYSHLGFVHCALLLDA